MAIFHFLWLSNIPLCVCIYIHTHIHIHIYVYIPHLLYPLILREVCVKPPTPLFGVHGRKHPLILLKMTDEWWLQLRSPSPMLFWVLFCFFLSVKYLQNIYPKWKIVYLHIYIIHMCMFTIYIHSKEKYYKLNAIF